MTANFGCRDRRTMASQPSVYNEERNLLRLRAWEQRNQDSNQAKELNPENVPLFGQPYKTNKGDELSNRIQRMLGSYEDVNYSCPLTIEPLPIPSFVTVSQSDQGQPSIDKSADAPFHNHIHYIDQKKPSRSSFSSQPTMMSAASSPNQHGHSSTLSNISLNQSEGRQSGNPAHQQKKNEALSDVSERVSLTQESSAQSPDDKLQPFLHSSYHNDNNLDTKDTFDRHQESTDHFLESTSTMDVSTVNIKLSPKDVPVTLTTKALPSQTFPPLLPSKQPSVVMTQKPTAYVRPMDGQDQVVSDSPELKPSPEPYVPLPESISKSNLGKKKILPQLLEARANETLCVEDILREMTHAWPPLLTAIHTPSIEEPSKSLFSAKEAEHVSSCPSQNPSQLNQKSSTFSFEAAHSSGVESASSSDSESSSRSESDSEGTTGEPHGPPDSSSVKTEPDAPAVSHGDWQLGNWIRSNQPNSSTETQGNTQVSENKRLVPNPKHSSVDSCRESKLQLPTRQKEPSDNTDKLQQCRESHQDNCYQQSSQKLPSPNIRKVSRKTQASKPAKEGYTDPSEADFSVKCEETVVPRNKDLCFTHRPKVKTKTKHCKKSKDSDTKKESKRASKHTVLDKRKVKLEPDDKLSLIGHCPSCGVQYPNPCSCPTKSPTQPVQPVHLSSDQPVKISSSKPKAETTCQGASKKPHKTTHKRSEIKKVKGPQVLLKAPQSLLVKIDLSLLSIVPQTSGTRRETSSNAKRSALVIEPDERAGSGASMTHKPCKKSKASNVEVDKKTPRKKRRLENNNTSSAHVLIKLESSSNPEKEQEKKKAKKNPASLPVKETAKESKLNKRCSSETQDSCKKKVKSKDSCKHKQKSVKQTEQPHSEKKPPKSCLDIPSSSSQCNKDVLINRPMLRFEDRHYPVKHYIKEAKRLKHRADAESDKLSKAFNYLDAAMFFVESGIAMEKDPQISMSSYTMFAETVDLLKFVLKLRNSVDPSTTPSEKDFIALCLKCQSLLQMAMFRHKHKTALKYSKTLTDHFSNSSQAPHDAPVSTAKAAVTPSPMPDSPSPANMSSSSGPGSNHSGSGLVVGPVSSTVVVPQAIEQVAFSYVNITMLFLGAHDMWEQAEALVHKGSGMLSVLDTVLGPLSLTSTMNAMVRYTRQGVHWLRLDSQKVK
ncbi:AF4/FMR2 family member 1 isoform X1 [Solea solea]|uniref:AF4/FMR2 family member 1 isoform X1 n=2 Tax=Solea solea TaxID=90069 RepID=UPI00272D0B70|nr:AF4/FMR2 family member 1 isoform X1 [Solea solea]